MSTVAHDTSFEQIPQLTNMRISKVITTPKGASFRAVVTGATTTLIDTKHSNTIIVVAPPTTSVDLPGLGDIIDGIGSALVGLGKLLFKSCTPVQTTKVSVDKDGKVTSIETTQTCVPN